MSPPGSTEIDWRRKKRKRSGDRITNESISTLEKLEPLSNQHVVPSQRNPIQAFRGPEAWYIWAQETVRIVSASRSHFMLNPHSVKVFEQEVCAFTSKMC